MDTELLFSDSSVWAARVGTVMVANWFGPPSPASARGQTTAMAASVARRPEPMFAILVVTDAGVSLPDQATRDVFTSQLTPIAHRISRQAIAIEGQGFAVSALRAAVAGMSLVSGGAARFPTRFFADVLTAAAYAQPSETTRVASEVTRLRALHGKR